MENVVDDVKNAMGHVAKSGAECTAQFRFSPDLALFSGHFPSDPVLPGVLQIEMIRAAVNAAHGTSHRISVVKTAKFRRPIRPGEVIALHVALSETSEALTAKGTASFAYEIASQTTVLLHPTDAAS